MNLREVIILTAMYYEKTLSEPLLEMYLGDLADMPQDRVIAAYQAYRRDPKNRAFPLPAQIRDIVFPQADEKLIAIEVARKIDKACIKHGYYWSQGMFGANGTYWLDDKSVVHSTFKGAVLSELGALGWAAICARGGWEQIAHSANEMQEGTFIAQLREQVHAALALQKQGVDVAQLDMPKREAQLEQRASGFSSPAAVLDFARKPGGA